MLDTNVLIDGIPPLPHGSEVAISAVTLSELHYGVLCARDDFERGRRLQRLEAVEAQFSPVAIDATVARIHGQMTAAVAAIGRKPCPRMMNLLIAATAASVDAVLLTRNVDDFVGLDDFVKVVDPAEAGGAR
ncbi:type II toxin-antitoxin system VapC family toxin [Microbacterium karelineae]|uniref:type II toxin-antitoxin system VapC family toxin n=1 Tax=Microbacterium karelineae TaxID=2654283 RepID=UPI003F668803